MEMRLNWFRRADGYWNADCQCGSALCGFEGPNVCLGAEETPEEWHFRIAKADQPARPPCGPVAVSEEDQSRTRDWKD